MRSKVTLAVVIMVIFAFSISTGIAAEKTLNIVFTVKNSVNPS